MKLGGILVLAAALVLTGCASTPPPVSDKVAQYYSSPPPGLSQPKAAKLPDVMAKLADPAQPWTLGVIGDSTGDAKDEWVYKSVAALAAKHGRPAVIRTWSIDTQSYKPQETIAEGAGAPITVWNGSAAGKDTAYSKQFVTAMMPERPDLLIVNHGHNTVGGVQAKQGVYALVDWAVSAWPAPPAIAVMLQNPRTDANAVRQDSVVENLRGQWTGSDVTLIDAYKAFTDHGGLPGLLLPDGFHPNAAGSDVWTSAVLAVLA